MDDSWVFFAVVCEMWEILLQLWRKVVVCMNDSCNCKKVVIVHTHNNIFSQLQRFFLVLYMDKDFFWKIVVRCYSV